MNGRLAEAGARICEEGSQVNVVVSFPIPMDKTATEEAVRRHTEGVIHTEWSGDRTLRMVVGPGGPFSIDVRGATARDRTVRLAAPKVHVMRPVRLQLAKYSVADLMAGDAHPIQEWHVTAFPSFNVSPDGERLIVYKSDPTIPCPADPYILDILTGERTTLRLTREEPWFAFAGWLPDGRLLLVGREVWVGGSDAEELTSLGSVGMPVVAVPSPSGEQLALWSPDNTEEIAILNLASGQMTLMEGTFRHGAGGAALPIQWSPEGKRIAAQDFATPDLSEGVVRVVSVPDGGLQWEAEGVRLLAWLASGEILVQPLSAQDPPSPLLLLSLEGRPSRTLPAGAPLVSPTGSHILIVDYEKGEVAMYEVSSGRLVVLPLRFKRLFWTTQGELITVQD